MKLPSSITLCEVGLRDGLQNEATLLTVHQKIALLLGLIDAGFKVIEVGSFMHPKAVPQMANTDEVYKAIGEIPDVELRALIPNLRGITRAIDCGCKKVDLIWNSHSGRIGEGNFIDSYFQVCLDDRIYIFNGSSSFPRGGKRHGDGTGDCDPVFPGCFHTGGESSDALFWCHIQVL